MLRAIVLVVVIFAGLNYADYEQFKKKLDKDIDCLNDTEKVRASEIILKGVKSTQRGFLLAQCMKSSKSKSRKGDKGDDKKDDKGDGKKSRSVMKCDDLLGDSSKSKYEDIKFFWEDSPYSAAEKTELIAELKKAMTGSEDEKKAYLDKYYAESDPVVAEFTKMLKAIRKEKVSKGKMKEEDDLEMDMY